MKVLFILLPLLQPIKESCVTRVVGVYLCICVCVCTQMLRCKRHSELLEPETV